MDTRAGGPRAKGTDGGDFLHRERVATHYTLSAVNKSRLHWTLVLHGLLMCLMCLRCFPDLLGLVGVRCPRYWPTSELPQSALWQLAWLTSGAPSLMAWFSLSKNRSGLLYQYVGGAAAFGIGPLLYGAIAQWSTLKLCLANPANFDAEIPLFLGVPEVILWYAFIAVALQLHAFGIYFATQLCQAWAATSKKKK